MKLLTSLQMQKLDREAIESLGIPAVVLMENAARALSREIVCRYPLPDYPQILALAGKGNNGGDAIAAARILSGFGYRVMLALLAQPAELKDEAARQLEIYGRLGLVQRTIGGAQDLHGLIGTLSARGERLVVIDGLFGVGLQSPILSGFWAELIDEINTFPGPVVAVDLPSGVTEAAAGSGKRVMADLTVTFQEPKTALIEPENRAAAGSIRVVDIGIPHSLYQSRPELISWIDRELTASLLTKRDPFAHKYRYGHGLAVVGSERMPGAGVLAVRAALRSGIGLCTAMIPAVLRDVFINACPETMLLFRNDEIDWDRYSTVLLGPGMGRDKAAAALLRQVLSQFTGTVILDADALYLLAENESNRVLIPVASRLVLTPHAGEMARLLGWDVNRVQTERVEATCELSRRYRATVVLKGKYSLLCGPSGRVFVNPTGNPGMACAGSGDVLSGLILGLAAQFGPETDLERLVCAAVWLHGRSGDLAASVLGQLPLKAGDLIDHLAAAVTSEDRDGIQI